MKLRYRASWVGLIGPAALVLSSTTPSPAPAQVGVQADTLVGRVISSDSTAIPSARISAVDDDGRVAQGHTDSDGRYFLTVLNGRGRYALTVQALGYHALSTVVQRPPSGGRIVRDLRLNVRTIVLDTLHTSSRRPSISVRTATPGESFEGFSSFTTELFPRAPGDLQALAALAPGVVQLGPGVDGLTLSIAGQPPGQNRITADGASFGAGQLPAEGLRSVATLTNVYDVSHGQFSGGEIAAQTIAGTNRWGGAFSMRLDDPALHYGRAPGSAPGSGDRNLFASGGGGGALIRNRLFVYGALDLSRGEGRRPSLESSDAAALRALRVAEDSVRRFTEILVDLGVPLGHRQPDALRESASGVARIDYTLSTDHSLTVRGDGRISRRSGIGASPLRIGGALDDHQSTDAGVLAQLVSGWDLWGNELRLYHSRGADASLPGSIAPSGQVRVSSLIDGGPVSSLLGFGPPAFTPADSDRSLWELSNQATRQSASGAHLLRAGVILQEERYTVSDAHNRHGTFVFHSLDDLASGRPASFTRNLGGVPTETSRRYGALYAGDTWTPSPALALVYGLRVEGSWYGDRPALSPAVETLLPASRPDIPRDLLVSPRIGFDYRLGGRRSATVRGGMGVYGGTRQLRMLAAAWNETGTFEAGMRLVCIGSAAPVPEWAVYSTGAGAIPTTCANEGTGFANVAAPVTVFQPGFRSPRVWRTSLGLSGSLGPRSSFRVNTLLALGTGVPTAVDRNLRTHPAFALEEEGGRPVYVEPGSIEPGTGMVLPGAPRLQPALGTVREVDARGRSRTGQMAGTVVTLLGKNTLLAVTYTYTSSVDQAGAVAAPGGPSATSGTDPLALEWAPSDLDRRHSFNVILTDRLTSSLQVSAIGQLGSGLPFTPRVAGDVNGDGRLNDRAFVFAPGANPDPADGMERLLAEAPGAVRACLRRQAGSIAGRNSCRTAWWSSVDLMAEYTPRRFTSSRRLVFTLTAFNVPAGVDHLLHGSERARGWGQFPLPDPNLLEIRGFDPDSRSYRYAVNPRFGQAVGEGALHLPFRLALQGRVTVGDDPRRQPIVRLIEAMQGARGPAQIRAKLSERVRNVPATVLALDATAPGELGLTPEQISRLQAAAAELEPRVQAALDGLSGAFGQRGPMTAARRAGIEENARAGSAVFEAGIAATREILRPDQWTKLPMWLVQPADVEDLMRPPPIEIRRGPGR